jgi:hypothetical protein
MGMRNGGEMPGGLRRARERFERWRSGRKVRCRIPDSLWASAVKVAKRWGIHRTSRVLRVNYYSLKKRVELDQAASSQVTDGSRAATFIELSAGEMAGPCECTFELEDGAGSKMHVHLKGITGIDLAALSRSFWGFE